MTNALATDDAGRPAPSITLEGLEKSFSRDVIALDGVDLTIRAGEFFTLLGPSGCGKTTLLRILAGLDTANKGVVRIGGHDVTEVPPHKRSVNTVFQSYALFPHLNVEDNIAFGLKMQGVEKDDRQRRVREMAEFIKLTPLLGRRIDQLSGGQRQRIALARALVCEPNVLLLDEPLSALDAGLRGQLQVELQRIQRRLGMTFVFVTHDQQEAMVMSDRIAVLNNGKIQHLGTPREIFERPANTFVARFMGHDNLFDITSREGDLLDTPLGRLTVDTRTHGDKVLIRPETIELGEDAETDANYFTAVVRESFYRGSYIEYRLDVGEVSLRALSSNQGQKLHKNGERVPISICPEDIVTVTDGE
ncbi:ABC transporter ATP-binding protein [Larsenimonas rhizosphaerae]|uniref:Spermidine/putrescine import ATP-binding protein PotA n=1 Tax=Larsenimonas rhizosphaerae TaxID=2944682 RepID=A0AA41ZEH7_9GAMM|nr:ABC transporter ATP-binding protein [Larsenimonas rhizosphaerae]MCM2131112.1 ABC transporter ATP-binding protein [Larsenimonas rhizosphaerae]MCX2523817.1 ABC transporter ATP-binding protein [Larsenimonas rhizosphaerae]